VTDQALVETDVPSDHMTALTDKQRALVEALVHDGLKWKIAAQRAGLSERHARDVIRMPAVLKAVRLETQVLRSSLRPRAIANMAQIGDQRRNLTAAVQANARLMGEEDAARAAININITPGYVIDLGKAERPTIEVDYGEVIRVDGADISGSDE
jgi:hypothetical protein